MARLFTRTSFIMFVIAACSLGSFAAMADDEFELGKCYDYERETEFNGKPKTSYGEVCLGQDGKWTIKGERFSSPPIDKTNSVTLIVSEEGIIHVMRREPQLRRDYRYDRRYHDHHYVPRPSYNPNLSDHKEDEDKDEGGMPTGLDFSR